MELLDLRGLVAWQRQHVLSGIVTRNDTSTARGYTPAGLSNLSSGEAGAPFALLRLALRVHIVSSFEDLESLSSCRGAGL